MQILYYLSQLACIIPAILYFLFTFFRLKQSERAGEFILVVISGMASTLPAVLLSHSWNNVVTSSADVISGVPREILLFFQAFFVVALAEEICKYLSVQWTIGQTDGINSLREGMVMGAGASLGFALVENIFYHSMTSNAQEALLMGLARGVTAVPFHGMAGAIIGYAIGRARIEKKLTMRQALQIRMEGLILAIALHGLYDYLLFLGGFWSFGILPVLAGMVMLTIANMNHSLINYNHQAASQSR